MVDKELLERIDGWAFQNKPLPNTLNRNDKTVYRMYYSFMRMLYMLYRTGTLGKERLKAEKAHFIKETEVLFVMMEAAYKTIREQQDIQEYGSITEEGAADVGVEGFSCKNR